MPGWLKALLIVAIIIIVLIAGVVGAVTLAALAVGIIAMRERAEMLGGTIQFLRPPEGGTLVRLRVPIGGTAASSNAANDRGSHGG